MVTHVDDIRLLQVCFPKNHAIIRPQLNVVTCLLCISRTNMVHLCVDHFRDKGCHGLLMTATRCFYLPSLEVNINEGISHGDSFWLASHLNKQYASIMIDPLQRQRWSLLTNHGNKMLLLIYVDATVITCGRIIIYHVNGGKSSW
jgi:hypothetical protein